MTDFPRSEEYIESMRGYLKEIIRSLHGIENYAVNHDDFCVMSDIHEFIEDIVKYYEEW